MLPFLGQGERGAERGVKLALIGQFLNVRLDDLLGLTCFCQIAGIKEGLYDVEALAAYLLYRLNLLNPICM